MNFTLTSQQRHWCVSLEVQWTDGIFIRSNPVLPADATKNCLLGFQSE